VRILTSKRKKDLGGDGGVSTPVLARRKRKVQIRGNQVQQEDHQCSKGGVKVADKGGSFRTDERSSNVKHRRLT